MYEEYVKAPEVTRRRMYLETMEKVLGDVNKVILDGDAGQGVVPYLPLDQLRSGGRTPPPPLTGAAAGLPPVPRTPAATAATTTPAEGN